MDYSEVFDKVGMLEGKTINIFGDAQWSVLTVMGILLFIGAMGKSAQVPLHVWLPDSMEGPTPISALIHAATMVTAGIFMVSRMSPIFELSTTALSFIMVIGSITAFFMGLIGIVQNDIKRVVAYSTLSQLGYMTAALGASAYAASVFHLMTHAFFKALLFLGAGAVIIAMHHEQDMRKMGGLKKYLPITYWTGLIGTLALTGFPGFSGFMSKDAIIEAVHHSHLSVAGFAYILLLLGVFVTAFYSFRLLFLVFHGKERMDEETRSHIHEPGWVVTLPLVALAIPSVLAGMYIKPMLFGSFFDGVITVDANHDVLAEIGSHYHGYFSFVLHGIQAPPFWLAVAGAFSAWFIYMVKPSIAQGFKEKLSFVHTLLDNKYYFDQFNQKVFAGGAIAIGKLFGKKIDSGFIDGLLVNGSANLIGRIAGVVRRMQTGYLYDYSFVMIIGLIALMGWFIFRV